MLNRSRGSGRIAVDFCLCAITGDMASLTAAIAGFASSIKRTTVRSSAVTGDVTCLSQLIFLG